VVALVAFAFLAVPLFASQYLYTEVLIRCSSSRSRGRAQHSHRLLAASSRSAPGASWQSAPMPPITSRCGCRRPTSFWCSCSPASWRCWSAFSFGLPSLAHQSFYLAVATLAVQFSSNGPFARIKMVSPTTRPPARSRSCRIELFRISDRHAGQDLHLRARNCGRASPSPRESGARPDRAHVDGHSRYGYRGRDHRHQAIARQALGLRRLIILYRGRRRAVGFLRLGSWEPLAFDVNRSFQVLFMIIIGGLGTLLGSFLGAAFIFWYRSFSTSCHPGSGLACRPTRSRTSSSCCSGNHRVLPDRRAARPGAALAIAKEKLRLWPSRIEAATFAGTLGLKAGVEPPQWPGPATAGASMEECL